MRSEAELIALCAFADDVAYCRKIANELGFLQLRPTVIHEDNLGTKAIADNGNFKGRSKHFELRWRFLHHYINRGVVTIKAIKRDLHRCCPASSSSVSPCGTYPTWRVFILLSLTERGMIRARLTAYVRRGQCQCQFVSFSFCQFSFCFFTAVIVQFIRRHPSICLLHV